MNNNLRDKIEYTVLCISEFARSHRLTLRQAFGLLKSRGGIDFLDEYYDVEHTLSIDDAIDDLTALCPTAKGAAG